MLALAACGEQDTVQSTETAQVSSAGKMDVLLDAVVNKGVSVANAHKAFPKSLVRLKTGSVAGKQEVLVDVFLQADVAAMGKLKALGAVIRTVTSSGIMTATVPVNALRAIAALNEVERIEASRPVKLANDRSNMNLDFGGGFTGGMNNPGYSATGSSIGVGVIVGVIDTGIDWTHGEFINADGSTRIVSYWDQTDYNDDKPPAGFARGHEYTRAEINVAVAAARACTISPQSTSWLSACPSPIKASARDTDGHGTHVAGTSAGNGSATGKAGAAPGAELVIVKFDFDGTRNDDTYIVDGINYIFKTAAAEGKPAVINMSLGTDYGPHDGTTLEERGIDDLSGPGKIVVVAAGNPGSNNWSQKLRWGYALHGQGTLGSSTIELRIPVYAKDVDSDPENYAFFDIWYPGGNKCRVKVTAPNGVTYPPPSATRVWVTGSSYAGYNTAQGAILVGNGGDQLGWSDSNADHEAYVEISDYWGTAPAAGTWKIQLVAADAKSVCNGTFHGWHGTSDNIVQGWRDERALNPGAKPTPTYGGLETNNAVTIGSPATANSVIAVAAYMTRSSWQYAYGVGSGCQPIGGLQDYADAPIGYYDPFEVGELASFSGRGPRRELNKMVKPEIAAPGVGIASALSHFVLNAEFPNKCISYWTGGPYHFGTNRVLPDLETTVLQGTSMATPNATGAIAVLLQARKDLQDKCLRKLFATTARHDTATDVAQSYANSAQTDTDATAGTDKPNFDWGYGKLDIGRTLAAMPTCTNACTADADCGTGFTCSKADPCCWTCVAKPPCKTAGASCTVNSDCCSNSCAGKPGKKTCK